MRRTDEVLIRKRIEALAGGLFASGSETDPSKITLAAGRLRSELICSMVDPESGGAREALDACEVVNSAVDEWLARAMASLLEKRTAELTDRAMRDPLTMVYNRAAFELSLRAEIERSERYRREFSVALFDIDHFKQVNDSFGHPEGDRLLRRFARILASSLRQSDSAYRCGGDEFAAICPETGPEAMINVARRIETQLLQGFEDTPFAGNFGISWGLASFPADGQEMDRLVRSADERLYRCKREHHFHRAAC